jgi:hypothetical protein
MGRFTSSRIARIFNVVLLDCATLAVGGAGLTIVGLAALRCFWNIDLTYNNEGGNAYFQAAALRGDNVYPPADAFIFNIYPPLSFVVIGALARFGGDVVVIGRLISVGSLIVIAISSGIIVDNLSNRSTRSGIVAAAVCLAAFCVISPVYVGIDDPQLFGQAIMTIALSVYTRAPERSSNLLITVVLMAIAGMVKHNMWAVPIAIAFDVLLRSPRRAMLFLTFSILALLSCALWMQVISDGRIWSSLMGNLRPYSFLNAAKLMRDFFASAFPLVLIGAIGVVGRLSQPGPRLVASYGFVALLVGVIFGGATGVDQNVYFDVIIASALGVGLLIDELVGRASMSFVGIPGTLLAALLIVASVISPVFQDLNKFRAFYLLDDRLARAFSDGTSYLRAQPGDAICHNLLLCFRAGKPFVFDIWTEVFGRSTPEQVSNLMESGVVKTVQLSEGDADLLIGGGLPNSPNSPWQWKKEFVDQSRFYKEVRQRYKLHHRSTGLAFFVAR